MVHGLGILIPRFMRVLWGLCLQGFKDVQVLRKEFPLP